MTYSPGAQETPPYVGAGAKARIGISNPTLGVNYRVSVHTQPILPPASIAPPNDWTYGNGSDSWQYLTDGGSWGGSESGIVETLNGLLGVLKAGYGANWTLSLLRLERYVPASKVFVRCSPFPTVAAVAGTFATEPSGATDPALGNVTSIVLPTYPAPNDAHRNVGRVVLKLPAWELNPPHKRVHGVTGSTTPSGIVTAAVTALIAYLAGSATRIVGHNGGPADDIATIDVAPSPRIARAAGLIT